ncbi:hypothetical protein BMS3Abin04_01203 [bacterium BMS3Abin04]|nr:hypothetical protein BMS3Abin04_01203 [bacterium BMS3Abin04]
MIERKVFKQLLSQKVTNKIVILIGAGQVGKTTLLKALYDELSKNFHTMYLDLDIYSNHEKISSLEKLINYLKLNGYKINQKEKYYLLLDEFQRYTELTLVMKNLYDNYPNIKIYASGSSSLTIKSNVQESLAGRKRIFYIYPLDFAEYLRFKNAVNEIESLSNLKTINGSGLNKLVNNLQSYWEQFLVYGGYPEVALQTSNKRKIEVLESIFDLYVKRDLIEYLNIKKILEVKKIIEFLAVNHGRKIKYEEIAQISSLKFNEVKNHIGILKETFITLILRPFYSNKNKELVKIPKIYFIDNGVRNYFINNFNNVDLRNDKGILLESVIISEILKSGVKENQLKYWQDKNKHEVDLILDYVHKQTAVEIKYKLKLKRADIIGLKKFSELYPDAKKYLINLDYQKCENGINYILPYNVQSYF